MVFPGESKLVEELSRKYGISERMLYGICDSAEDLELFAANLASGVKGPTMTQAEAEKRAILEGGHWYATRAEIEAMDDSQYRRWREAGGHEARDVETLEETDARLAEVEAQEWEKQHQQDKEAAALAEEKRLEKEVAREAENARLESLSDEAFYRERNPIYKEEK
jgi:hypothetical protein